jgi:hypothetical protein
MCKTGTTSLARALDTLGYKVGDQRSAEHLIGAWASRQWGPLLEYIDHGEANAFQDIPFGLDFTFQILDVTYPGSKFILSRRRSPEAWYESIRSFHGRVFASGKNTTPTREQLELAMYHHYPGWAWEVMRDGFFIRNHTLELYDKAYFMGIYNRHNKIIQDYFLNRHEVLLNLNIEEPGAFQKLCAFLSRPCSDEEMMPHALP